MTPQRREQLEDLLWISLSPRLRFTREQMERNRKDEADYDWWAARYVRVKRLYDRVRERLYPFGTPLDVWATLPDDAPLPSSL